MLKPGQLYLVNDALYWKSGGTVIVQAFVADADILLPLQIAVSGERQFSRVLRSRNQIALFPQMFYGDEES
ncbi:hypothetical protein D3C75_1093020 [compost metagenome]